MRNLGNQIPFLNAIEYPQMATNNPKTVDKPGSGIKIRKGIEKTNEINALERGPMKFTSSRRFISLSAHSTLKR